MKTLRAVPMALLLTLALFWGGGEARAEMYKWTDSSGNVHITDNLFNVPQEYLSQIKTYQESRGGEEAGDIPLKKTDSGFMLAARINGDTDVNLILDTGATATVISPDAIKRAGIKLDLEKMAVLRTVGGEVKAPLVSISSVAVGGFRQGPMTIVVHDAVKGTDGLLGMDFLGRYHFEILTYGPKLRLTIP